MAKPLTVVQKKMRKIGAIGGHVTVETYGSVHMRKIIQNYWNSPEGMRRRSMLKDKSKK